MRPSPPSLNPSSHEHLNPLPSFVQVSLQPPLSVLSHGWTEGEIISVWINMFMKAFYCEFISLWIYIVLNLHHCESLSMWIYITVKIQNKSEIRESWSLKYLKTVFWSHLRSKYTNINCVAIISLMEKSILILMTYLWHHLLDLHRLNGDHW